MAQLIAFGGRAPVIAGTAFVAPGARLIGDVEIGAEASIWYNCVLRGDVNRIHVDSPQAGDQEGHATIIGEDVLIGHLAMVHGCILHDRAFVGLGAIVMDGCEIESDAMLAAGAMLTPGKRIPAGQLWAGRPAKYVRDLSPEELAGQRSGVAHYVALAKAHKEALSR
jgi:carbonic anhydrase/acetyltransferase-like protein (isoleucine patch superfamily)